ncbi:unnamed protein product [Pedinophyceae sp. YPF-701]|nr:unnamed protein product [Pedinophyceae sp. YPF-701]
MSGTNLKEFLKKYGRVGVAVHFGYYGVFLAGIYAALKSNVDVTGMLKKTGLLGHKEAQLDEEGNMINYEPSWLEKTLDSGGTLAVAFVCNKALMPVRGTVTVATTPFIARVIERLRARKAAARP